MEVVIGDGLQALLTRFNDSWKAAVTVVCRIGGMQNDA